LLKARNAEPGKQPSPGSQQRTNGVAKRDHVGTTTGTNATIAQHECSVESRTGKSNLKDLYEMASSLRASQLKGSLEIETQEADVK
jgi:hypothetical protein